MISLTDLRNKRYSKITCSFWSQQFEVDVSIRVEKPIVNGYQCKVASDAILQSNTVYLFDQNTNMWTCIKSRAVPIEQVNEFLQMYGPTHSCEVYDECVETFAHFSFELIHKHAKSKFMDRMIMSKIQLDQMYNTAPPSIDGLNAPILNPTASVKMRDL